MKITEISHNCNHFFLNGDFVSFNNYVIINDLKEVFRNGRRLETQGNYSFEFPKVKILSSDRFLLIDSGKSKSAEDQRKNAWIISNNGIIEKSFYLGSVQKVVTTEKYIICSYSDSQLDTSWKYGRNGLVVFDYNGQSKFEYYRDDQNSNISMLENYAFLTKNEDVIYYMPYPNFSIVEFNLLDFSSRVVCQIPNSNELNNDFFWNPKAFTKKGKNWFFITPNIEKEKSLIFKMDTQKRIEQIGDCCFSQFPQGIQDGRFFIPFSGGKSNSRKCQIIEI